MEHDGYYQPNPHFIEVHNSLLGGFAAPVDHGGNRNGFDRMMRYFRAPFDATNPDVLDQRAAQVQEIYDDLRDQIEELERREEELARMYAENNTEFEYKGGEQAHQGGRQRGICWVESGGVVCSRVVRI